MIWNHDVIHKTGSTQCVALPSEKDRATATGNMYRKICWNLGIRFSRYASGQTSRQTNSHTDTLITILCTPRGRRSMATIGGNYGPFFHLSDRCALSVSAPCLLLNRWQKLLKVSPILTKLPVLYVTILKSVGQRSKSQGRKICFVLHIIFSHRHSALSKCAESG